MNMEKVDRHHFVKFPYRAQERPTGEVNNGGIDLIAEPERINEIHEVESFPWLKNFLVLVNAKDGLFMTLGCVAGYVEGSFCGYIDLSIRPTASLLHREKLPNLDEMFYAYLERAMPEGETRTQALKYAHSILHWTLSPLEIHGEFYSKVNVNFDAAQEDGVVWAIEHLAFFLTNEYPLLPHAG